MTLDLTAIEEAAQRLRDAADAVSAAYRMPLGPEREAEMDRAMGEEGDAQTALNQVLDEDGVLELLSRLRAAEAPFTPALAAIAAERRRQIEAEGWTPEHDDQHTSGELAAAAAAYIEHARRFRDAEANGYPYATKAPNPLWPWCWGWWKPKSPRHDLVRAAALILAELERLDRAAAREAPPC